MSASPTRTVPSVNGMPSASRNHWGACGWIGSGSDIAGSLEGQGRTLRCLFVPSQKKQWVSSRARAAAIETARRKQNRRRLIAAIAAGVLVIALVGAFALNSGGGKATIATPPTTAATSSTTSTTLASVAGKPCVAVADLLPVGAPDGPVDVGPPPAPLISPA